MQAALGCRHGHTNHAMSSRCFGPPLPALLRHMCDKPLETADEVMQQSSLYQRRFCIVARDYVRAADRTLLQAEAGTYRRYGVLLPSISTEDMLASLANRHRVEAARRRVLLMRRQARTGQTCRRLKNGRFCAVGVGRSAGPAFLLRDEKGRFLPRPSVQGRGVRQRAQGFCLRRSPSPPPSPGRRVLRRPAALPVTPAHLLQDASDYETSTEVYSPASDSVTATEVLSPLPRFVDAATQTEKCPADSFLPWKEFLLRKWSPSMFAGQRLITSYFPPAGQTVHILAGRAKCPRLCSQGSGPNAPHASSLVLSHPPLASINGAR